MTISHESPRMLFMNTLRPRAAGMPYAPAAGSAVSTVCVELMEATGVFFPEAHLDAEAMAALAMAGRTVLGFDNVMPLFSTWHECAALGAQVDWGARDRMPDCREPMCSDLGNLVPIPADFERRPPMRVACDAIRLLKRRLGDAAAVVGKVFGPWTLGYDVYGVENFLMATLDEPDRVKRAMRHMIEITIRSANAQLEAGADALTVGDHCTRDLCSPDAYRDFLRDIHAELVERIKAPLILHICGDTSDRIRYIRETRVAMFHFDSKTGLDAAVAAAGEMPLMGGTANISVIRDGDPDTVARDVAEKLDRRIAVIGPECAVPLDAPVANLKALTAAVKRFRERA